MPLPGGDADKIGNRYEGRWTIACMIEVMDEEADSIRLEPPGFEGEGSEFWLSKGGGREYHQVKRQNSALGHWTLAELSSKGILLNFLNKLIGSTDGCVFISTHAADQLEELAYRAMSAASNDEFQKEFLNAEKLSKAFLELRSRWGNCSQQEAYEFLQRIKVQTVSEDFLANTVEYKLKTLVEGEPSSVSAELFKFALDSIHKELTAVEIWNYIESRGFKRLEWAKDPHVLASVEAANKRYLKPIADSAIANQHLPVRFLHHVSYASTV